jgi:hypothetical protein
VRRTYPWPVLWAWLVGVLVLPGLGVGLGQFLWALWLILGVTWWMAGRRDEDRWWLGLSAALGLVGLLWWWATRPESWILGLGPYLGPVFWGTLIGIGVGAFARTRR